MGKNKEEFMKDREKINNTILENKGDSLYYYRELNNSKELLSKCKTLIADMVMYNLDDRPESYNDVMKQAQETLRELTKIIDNEK